MARMMDKIKLLITQPHTGLRYLRDALPGYSERMPSLDTISSPNPTGADNMQGGGGGAMHQCTHPMKQTALTPDSLYSDITYDSV